LKELPSPLPVQAPTSHPAQLAQRAPPGHWLSLVHQHETPGAVPWPLGDVASEQLPSEQDPAFATDVAVSQSSRSLGV
jgi:hypothetical protein